MRKKMPELNENVRYRFPLQESAHSNIHLVKLTRLLRLARLLQKMDRYSQYSAVILTMLMLFFIVVAHWLACIWYVIAEKERLRNDKDWDLGKSLSLSRNHLRHYLIIFFKLHSATHGMRRGIFMWKTRIRMKTARLSILGEYASILYINSKTIWGRPLWPI